MKRLEALFEQAKAFENRIQTKFNWNEGEVELGGHGYTWSSQGALDELVKKQNRGRKKDLVNLKRKLNDGWIF